MAGLVNLSLGKFYEPTYLLSSNPIFQDEVLATSSETEFPAFLQLLAINQNLITSDNDFIRALGGLDYGEKVSLTFLLSDGNSTIIEFAASKLSIFDQFAYFYLPFFIGIAFFLMAVWSFWKQRLFGNQQAFSIFSGAIAIVLCSSFDLVSTHYLYPLWIAVVALSGAGLFHLAIQQRNSVFLSKYIISLVYLLVAIIVFITWITPYSIQNPIFLIDYLRWILLFTALLFVISLLIFLFSLIQSINPIGRIRGFIEIAGGIISFGPIGFWIIVNIFGTYTPFSPWYLLPMAIFPILIGYSNQKDRLMRFSFTISRSAQYFLLALFVILGYGLLVSGAGMILQEQIQLQNPLFFGIIIFIIAVLFNPVRGWMQKNLDKLFFHGDNGFQERLNTFSGDLKGIVNIEDIVNLIRGDIHEAVTPTYFHLFLFDPVSDSFKATLFQQQKTSDIIFARNSAFVNFLGNVTSSQLFSDAFQLPSVLTSEMRKIKLLDAQLFIPLKGQEQFLGFLALAGKESLEPYSAQEINYLEALADQASLALDRLKVIENLERRVLELNVLTRVAQGVNYTIKLDDIYELFYTQTAQILPVNDVFIILRDNQADTLLQVFCIENNERLSIKENKQIAASDSLEKIVIESRQPLRIVDYKKACADRNIEEIHENIFAALFVPLNSGAETIGTAIVANRSPNSVYSREHLIILQAIADQVAGAIEKAKLLQETENRARQLSSLNDVTRQLTSTLALEPLLENVLDSSVKILNCEAGFLLMIDEESRELVCRVSSGPAVNGLVNKRLPYGSGEAGTTVRLRKPQIINHVKENPEWISLLDHQDGFQTNSILVVPLVVKNDLLGVIEVLNRKDGLPFSSNDQEILSAFAAQAAIAMENANLYTRTDQALTERVEELSIMQRIDRELNTSLDLINAMSITLNWAMQQSEAQAGLIGYVMPEGIQIFKSEGYDQAHLERYQNSLLPFSTFQIDEVIESGHPIQNWLDEANKSLHPAARTQIIVPIRREKQTMAIIFLESFEEKKLDEYLFNFLTRLSDHASIALVNGQLYSELQSANDAKSEFVSFVSHELKNPMTSIKGYTELLAAGAVGDINTAQGNFLLTIRSNIDRMNTLISDLSDLSKIEAGRLRLEFKAVSVNEIVDEVVRSTKTQIEEKNQQLEIKIAENLPLIWADSTRMVQIVVNLISNANKYTANNGLIRIDAEACENQWDPEGAREVVHFWVNDNGIGINPEDQKLVFEKFFRSEDPKTREVPGTGLGLNITQSLVEMQGGKIWFNSEFRTGTTFHVTIPVANISS